MSEILSENELQMIEDLHRYSDTGQSRTIRHLIASHRAVQAERDALKAELAKARRQTWQDAAEAYARYRQALIPQAGDWRKPEPFDEWCLRQAHGDIQP